MNSWKQKLILTHFEPIFHFYIQIKLWENVLTLWCFQEVKCIHNMDYEKTKKEKLWRAGFFFVRAKVICVQYLVLYRRISCNLFFWFLRTTARVFWGKKWSTSIAKPRKCINETSRRTCKEKNNFFCYFLVLLIYISFKIFRRKVSFSPIALHLFASKNSYGCQSFTCVTWKHVNIEADGVTVLKCGLDTNGEERKEVIEWIVNVANSA